MERALDPALLRAALGDLPRLPSAEELADSLAKAEIELLAGRAPPVENLLATGWFLFGVASSHAALERYGLPRQRSAFRVAAHIFDLALQRPELDLLSRLELVLGAQLAALRSEITPNAIAVYRRVYPSGPGPMRLTTNASQMALANAVALLGMDFGYVLRTTHALRDEVTELTAAWGLARVAETIFGAAAATALACRDLVVFLLYGGEAGQERARLRLEQAVQSQASSGDRSSRWAAAELLDWIDGLQAASIWTALPPDVPRTVRSAFVLTQPPIAQLWPPQVELFGTRGNADVHPLSRTARRQLISTPTSGGKTLFAQLLIATHIATEGTGVCYVAPTRSLCHEVRASLDRRLRHLGARIRADLPVGAGVGFGEDVENGNNREVEVMTPERLAHLVRTDPRGVLNRFGLFVIDEAHNLSDAGRGWTLESTVAYIHHATIDGPQRLVLVSAAIGNRNHFVQWLKANDDERSVIAFHSDWRGPRRVHCLWTTEAQWEEQYIEPANRGGRTARRRIPIRGMLSIRPTVTGHVHHLRTREPIGELVLRRSRKGATLKDAESTPSYRMIAPLVQRLMAQGPVLVIEATRPGTVRLASALAEQLPARELGPLQALIDLVVATLGVAHPLSGALRRGVAYHHGSLPLEVRTAIEEAVTRGLISCVVATTTLTEGVNLPVRSVVIATQGIRTGAEFNEFIAGPKLLNAIGRAGRAAKETEGVVVLARPSEFDIRDFDRLRPDDVALRVTSTLAAERSLAELAAFEALLLQTRDAVFEAAGEFVPQFLSFVWFLSSALDAVGTEVTNAAVRGTLENTLGWTQIETDLKVRWSAVAAAALERYTSTEASARRRWASVGAGLGSARRLDTMAGGVARNLPADAEFSIPARAVEFLLADGRLGELLALAEAPRRQVFDSRSGRYRRAVAIDTVRLIVDWVEGAELTTLAERYLAGVADIDYRYEQLGNLMNDYCETFLPWVLGTIVQWVNRLRAEMGEPTPFPVELAAYVRYGANSSVALRLAVAGVRSRRLCSVVALVWANELGPRDDAAFTRWLSSMTVAEWRQRFNASPAELRNLVEYTRERRSGVAEALLTGGVAEIPLEPRLENHGRSPAEILHEGGADDVREIEVRAGGTIVAAIPARLWPDVQVLLQSGIPFTAEAEIGATGAKLFLRAQELPDEAEA